MKSPVLGGLVIVALAGSFSSALADAHQELMDKIIERCGDGKNLKEEDIMKPFNERFQNPIDDSMKCFLKCFMQTEGWMTEDGEIPILPKITDYEKCTKLGDNSCERAYLFHKCVYDNGGDHVFKVEE